MRASPALSRVARGDLCAGCGACAALAPDKISMALSKKGFLRPAQRAELSAAEEEAVGSVCPGLVVEQRAEGRRDDVFWGPYLTIWKGCAVDEALRRQASSGGVISAVLTSLLARGAVDRVVQVGASPSLPIGNETVVSLDSESVFRAAGSRYAPSAPLEGLERHLAGSDRAAFVGKPCDVVALRALARRDPRVDERFPYKLSFFCAGVPSIAGARAVLAKLGVDEAELAAFRYRGDGWPGYATATRKDGSSERMSYAQSWGGILNRRVQFRCKICPDGVGGQADLVCADAWVCDEKGYPIFEDGEGESLAIARTETGAALLADALADGAVTLEPLDLGAIGPMQPGQIFRKQSLLARLTALSALLRPRPRYRGFKLGAAARTIGLVNNLRAFFGTCRRLLLPARDWS